MPAHIRHYLAAFFIDFALSAAFAVVPFYIFDYLGGGAAMSGYIGAAQSVTYGAACLILSGVLHRAPNKLGLAALGCAVFGVLVGFSPMLTHPVAFGAMTVAGLTSLCLFWPTMQDWLGGERDPQQRGRRIAMYNASWCLGLATGPVAAGRIYDLYGYAPAFGMVLVVAWIGAILVGTLPREEHYFAAVDDANEATHAINSQRAETLLYATWLASFLGWTLVGVCRTILPRRIDELADSDALNFWIGDGGLTFEAATQYSWLVFVLYITRVGISFALGRTNFWRYRFDLLIALQVCAALAFWVISATDSLVIFALACGVVGINGGVSFFASLEYSVANPAHKSRRAAIHESMTGLGSAAGSVIFGYLAGRFTTEWPFLYTPVLMGIGIALQIVLLQRSKRTLRIAD